MRIKQLTYERGDSNYPQMRIGFEESGYPDAIIHCESGRWIKSRGHDVVHLSPGFNDILTMTIDGVRRDGFTDNKEVIKATKMFMKALDGDGTFELGPVKWLQG